MFAFALWDRAEGRLHLARDRAGEKPLFYGWTRDAFVFGSELKALRAHPAWNGSVNRNSLALLARYGYIPSPHCIYENIYKLVPGCVLTLTGDQIHARKTPCQEPYWSLHKVAEAGTARPFSGDEKEAGEQLLELLRQSVARQMVADVPVGAFLSGGIDSSLVVALMQAQSHQPIRTFSIGFPQENINEARYAKAVARHLGTYHTELYVQARNLQQVIPRLPCIYDEPLADASQIPTVLLCQLAGSQVKVSLSGDAGDELFGGYDHYRKTQRIWSAIARFPEHFRKQLAGYLKSVANDGLDIRFNSELTSRILNRLSNLSDLLPAPTDRSLYHLLISPNRNPRAWLRETRQRATKSSAFASWENLPELLQRMMCLDFVSYLPDDILVKVDRAAMSVGLETRIPLLDHRIIEFAWSLPASFKQRGNQGKWLLRQILHQHVPRALVNRPKRGFAAPVAQWLRGPLRDWAEDLLGATRLRQEGFFEPRVIREKWQEHLSSKRDWSPGLWHVLMFQAWLDQQKVVPGHGESPTVIAARNMTEAEVCPPSLQHGEAATKMEQVFQPAARN
jgi:asparagine synthase (glutamine-hydrolysing)